jgi:hypothetical protein
MVALLLGAAAALLRERDVLAGVLLGLACLCRYEAWLAVPLAVFARRRRLGRALVLFGWAPLLWTLAWRGLSPAGTYVLDIDPATARLTRLPFLLGKIREYSGGALLLLAVPGLLSSLRGPAAWAIAYVGLVLLAIAGAGHEHPPGSGQVSERLAHVPVAALCALAGLALARLSGAPRTSRARSLRLASVLALLAWQGLAWARQTQALVATANASADLALSSAVARLADACLGPGDRLAVLAPTVAEAPIESYVRKVEHAGGDPRRAREVAAGLLRHSPDAARIAAQLARPPSCVIADPGAAALVAVFDDAPRKPQARPGPILGRFTAGARAVTVYRVAR